MTTFEKIADRVKQDLGYNLENLHRTYTGVHMKASGAFTWQGNEVGSNGDIGSCYPASELLKKKEKLETIYHGAGRIEII